MNPETAITQRIAGGDILGDFNCDLMPLNGEKKKKNRQQAQTTEQQNKKMVCGGHEIVSVQSSLSVGSDRAEGVEKRHGILSKKTLSCKRCKYRHDFSICIPAEADQEQERRRQKSNLVVECVSQFSGIAVHFCRVKKEILLFLLLLIALA
jgi:hypothetical protein